MDKITNNVLSKLMDYSQKSTGAYTFRNNGGCSEMHSTENIKITPKTDKPGIDIFVKANTKDESLRMPVVVSEGGMNDTVYNYFEIGENSDIVIYSGCGVHNSGHKDTGHDGVHDFVVKKGAKLKYIENHYAEGEGTGKKSLNPVTTFEVFEDATIELEMVQIEGVDSTNRVTKIVLHDGAKLIISESLLTTGNQYARSEIDVDLKGENSSAQVISRSVAKGNSTQVYYMTLNGEAKCKGHIQCDAIIMDNAKVSSIPRVDANHSEAGLIHEATVGRIASDQLTKLMTLGLTEEQSEEIIINSFLETK